VSKLNLELQTTSRATSRCLIILVLCKMLFVTALLLVKKFQLHLRRKKWDNACKELSRVSDPIAVEPRCV